MPNDRVSPREARVQPRAGKKRSGKKSSSLWERYESRFTDELENIRKLTSALEGHCDLQRDMEECRDFCRMRRLAVITLHPFNVQLVTSEHALALDLQIHPFSDRLLREHCVKWLTTRYNKILEDALDQLHISSHHFDKAFDAAIQGTWNDGIRSLETTAVRANILGIGPELPTAVDITVIRTEADVLTLADFWRRKIRQTPSLVMPLPQRGISQNDYVKAVGAAIDSAWSQIAPQALRVPTIHHPGRRKVGRARGGGLPGQSYSHRVRLYNLWREHPTAFNKRPDLWAEKDTITWGEFTQCIRNQIERGGLFEEWQTASERTVEEATEKAILWAAPDPEVATLFATFSSGYLLPNGLRDLLGGESATGDEGVIYSSAGAYRESVGKDDEQE